MTLSREKLEEFLDDIRWHQEWRVNSDRDAAYYDGHQLDAPVVSAMREIGLAPLIRNYVRPTVDLVLGMEAKNKRDWRLFADSEEDQKVSEALNAKLKSAERVSNADRACSDALAGMIKAGIHWVYVGRESDPFKSPYRVEAVHRNEIFFDWRAKEPDLSDARYLVRRKWFDEDTLCTWFPKKAGLIRKIKNDSAKWDPSVFDDPDGGNELLQAYDTERMTILSTNEWRDSDRKRLRLYEVWYKIWAEALVLTLSNGRVVEYDKSNLRHGIAVAMGGAKLELRKFLKPRQSWWIGPHLLADNPSPYPHEQFPYVPFIAAREDITAHPLGLVRHMVSPQDEINARLTKMVWLLSAKRIIADSDASDRPWAEVLAEASRPDALFLLNPNRKNKTADAFRVESDFALSAQQYEVMKDATTAIQDVAGVYQAQLGKEGAAESGVGINSLVEQGSTTLAEMLDNYRYSRTRVGELLLALITEDIGSNPMDILVDYDGSRRTVSLNQPSTDQFGMTYLENSVTRARLRVGLEEIPQTASYRQQQLLMFTEIVKSLPPDIMPLFADFMVRMTDLPHRDELVKRIQNHLGVSKDPEDMTPEEQQAAQAQAAEQQRAKDLAFSEQEAKIEKLRAEVEKLIAQVKETEAKAMKTQVEAVLAEDTQEMEAEKHVREMSQPTESESDTKTGSPAKRSAS